MNEDKYIDAYISLNVIGNYVLTAPNSVGLSDKLEDTILNYIKYLEANQPKPEKSKVLERIRELFSGDTRSGTILIDPNDI